jgi:hypothetical protein
MAEQLRDLGCLEDEPGNVPQSIVSQGLHDLRDEEEREFHWVLGENAMGILEDERIAVVSLLEEGIGYDGGNGSPEE